LLKSVAGPLKPRPLLSQLLSLYQGVETQWMSSKSTLSTYVF
jgi:hypothetical protein